jgi:hypothetical protein
MDAIQKRDQTSELLVYEPEAVQSTGMSREQATILKGIIIGVGIIGAAGAIWAMYRYQARRGTGGDGRARQGAGVAGVINGLSNLIGEGSSAFKDAVEALGNTFDAGIRAYERVQEVVGKKEELN